VALGPGKYDDLATYVREQTDAVGVIVIVVRGAKGDGFSVQASAEITAKLPVFLRLVADGIEADTAGTEPADKPA
jgi:1,4-dihydroxy-2-naphthoyl-CoA synthase